MIRHHPSGDLLTAYAAGRLAPGATLVMGSHIDVCDACRGEVSLLERLGGSFLADTAPALLSEGALDRVLKRLGEPAMRAPTTAPLPRALSRFDIPKRLRGLDIGARLWLAPGIWFAPIAMQPENETCTYLIYGAPNKTLPRHTHTGQELTVVLNGAYSDDLGHFAVGDFAEADAEITHIQTVTADAECLCLISSDGPMKFEALSARVIQSFAGHRY
jgi:putative transcriptional regulator